MLLIIFIKYFRNTRVSETVNEYTLLIKNINGLFRQDFTYCFEYDPLNKSEKDGTKYRFKFKKAISISNEF